MPDRRTIGRGVGGGKRKIALFAAWYLLSRREERFFVFLGDCAT